MNRGICSILFAAVTTACSGTGATDASHLGGGGAAPIGGAAGTGGAEAGGAIGAGGASTAGSPSGGGGGAGAGGKGGTADDGRSVPHPTKPMCPGGLPAPTTVSCNSTADCPAGQKCTFGNTQLPCLLGCAGPIDMCTPTAPCPDGQVCSPRMYQGTCSCGGGAMCIARCSANSCGAGSSCDASGFCVAIACDAGFVCPTGQICDPKGSSLASHGCRTPRCDEAGGTSCTENLVCVPGRGCVTKQCKTGADCDCGACSPELVGGARECVSRPGYCMQRQF